MQHNPIHNIESLPEFEYSTDLVNAFDPDHRILFWNKECEKLFGISKEIAVGQILEDLLPYVRTDERLHYLQRAFRGQKIYILKEKFRNSDSFYEQKLIPLKNEKGEVYAVVNIVRTLPTT